MQLKYLFTAIYNDGTVFKQTLEDVSSTNSTKSAYYDIDHDKLIAFALTKENEEFLVDLRDGHFEINGINLNNINFNTDDRKYCFNGNNVENKLRLIYYRQNTVSINHPGDITDHQVTYCFGWQTTDKNGNNSKKIMEIN